MACNEWLGLSMDLRSAGLGMVEPLTLPSPLLGEEMRVRIACDGGGVEIQISVPTRGPRESRVDQCLAPLTRSKRSIQARKMAEATNVTRITTCHMTALLLSEAVDDVEPKARSSPRTPRLFDDLDELFGGVGADFGDVHGVGDDGESVEFAGDFGA